jgi:hypothetical protein
MQSEEIHGPASSAACSSEAEASSEDCALRIADWSVVVKKADITVFNDHAKDPTPTQELHSRAN